MNYKDTAGTPGTSTAIKATTGSDARNSRDPYNSWDPRKAIGSNNIGHSRAKQQQDYYGLWYANKGGDVCSTSGGFI